jgi:hypothetical protein
VRETGSATPDRIRGHYRPVLRSGAKHRHDKTVAPRVKFDRVCSSARPIARRSGACLGADDLAPDKDAAGEIAPASVANLHPLGCRYVTAECYRCARATEETAEAPRDLPVPGVSLQMRCSVGGSRDASMDMSEYYRVLSPTTGWQPT